MSTPYTLSFPNDAGRLARVEDIPFKAERVKNLIGDNVIVNIGGVQADLFLDGYGHY